MVTLPSLPTFTAVSFCPPFRASVFSSIIPYWRYAYLTFSLFTFILIFVSHSFTHFRFSFAELIYFHHLCPSFFLTPLAFHKACCFSSSLRDFSAVHTNTQIPFCSHFHLPPFFAVAVRFPRPRRLISGVHFFW